MKIFFYLSVCFVIIACTIAQEKQHAPKAENIFTFCSEAQKQNPNAAVHLFAEGEHVLVNIITPNAEIPAHFHEKHDETVFIARGKGTMRIGSETKRVKEGDLIFLPKKTIHSFKPETDDCIAISIHSPKFDGKDRIIVSNQ